MTRWLVSMLILTISVPLFAQDGSELVPPGWQAVDPGKATRKFLSPNGTASLTVSTQPKSPNASSATRGNATDDERITYYRRTRSFIALSGYRGSRIFYRKSNSACRGTTWHVIELEYPAAAKKAMDGLVTRIAHGMNRYDTACAPHSAKKIN